MNSSAFEGLDFDPSNCSKSSVEERTEFVYRLSKWSHGASELLQTWSRQEILEILCAEMGKERKYTGLTKLKLIENLMKIVNEKQSQRCGSADLKYPSSSDIGQRTSKRQRKSDHPNRVPAAANLVLNNCCDNDSENMIYCKNSACKAKLSHSDAFCKRCSCCICHQYDDNKDPSLWLVCSSEPPYQSESCGMSCHLECAIKHETSGIGKEMMDARLDGAFYCVSCGKANDLLGSWKKQLIIAKETRRVDILGYRLSLCQKILSSTKRYQELHDIAEEAVKKLEADVGPLTGLPVKKARGIVNRLSSGPEVQRLCALALESLDLIQSNMIPDLPSGTALKGFGMMIPKLVTFEDVCSSSLTVVLGPQDSSGQNVVGYTLWHRKANETDYPAEPTCTLFAPTTRFLLADLTPDTNYVLKIVPLGSNEESGSSEVHFRTGSARNEISDLNSKSVEVDRSQSPATNCSSLSNPSSMEDETNNILPCSNEDENRGDDYLDYCNNTSKIASATGFQNFTNHTGKSQTGTIADTMSLSVEDHFTEKVVSVLETDTTNLDSNYSPEGQMVEDMSTENGSSTPAQTGLEGVPFGGCPEAGLPITPCKLENMKDGVQKNGRPKFSSKDLGNGSGREEEPQAGSSSKKRSAEKGDDDYAGIGDKDFEYYVKVIRWLECEGHIETAFRQKFLTWYSLKATSQEVRIVKVFVDTFIEDPASLAGQLVDTFSEVISNKRSCIVPAGFCLKLWH